MKTETSTVCTAALQHELTGGKNAKKCWKTRRRCKKTAFEVERTKSLIHDGVEEPKDEDISSRTVKDSGLGM